MELLIHSHNRGENVVPARLKSKMLSILGSIDFDFESSPSIDLRSRIGEQLTLDGWSSEVQVSKRSQITITSMKGSTALCVQTGNMSRFYADLLKLQYLYAMGRAGSALYIVPTKRRARQLGSNIANYERLTEEMAIFGTIISMPIMVIGLD